MFVSRKKYEAKVLELEYVEDTRRELKRKLEEQSKKLDDERSLAFKTMELDFKDKMRTEIDRLERSHRKELDKVKDNFQEKLTKSTEENFTKLKDSLSKLHEEGNTNTKYLEKMSIGLMESFSRSQRTALGYDKEE